MSSYFLGFVTFDIAAISYILDFATSITNNFKVDYEKVNFSLRYGFNGIDYHSEVVAGATETCNAYFAEVDGLIAKASEDPQAKTQLDSMKGQLEEGKKQIAALPKDQQDKACQQGIDALKQMKSVLGLQ